ncbi:MAG: hypothetical protein ACRC57_01860, partial [Sarcina sp.]
MNKIIYLYQKLSKEILEFMFENPTNDYFYKILGEKVVLSKLYESKLVSTENANIKAFIYNQRILNNTIYFLAFLIRENSSKDKIIEDFKNFIVNIDIKDEDVKYTEEQILNKFEKKFKDEFDKITDNTERLAVINLYRIIVRMKKSNSLIKDIDLNAIY